MSRTRNVFRPPTTGRRAAGVVQEDDLFPFYAVIDGIPSEKKKKKIVNIFVVYTGSVYKEHNAVGYETKKGFCVIFGPPESHATVNPSRRDRVRFEGVCARGRRNNSFSRPAGSGSLPRTYTRSGARAATGSSSPHCALAPPGGRTCPPHPYGRVHDECNTGKKMTPGRR